MKSRYWIAATTGILLASANPAAAQRASINATATVVAPAEAPTVSMVASGNEGGGLPSLVVDAERGWGVSVQVGDGAPVVYAEPRAMRPVELTSAIPVRVIVAAN